MFNYEYVSDATLKKINETLVAFCENKQKGDELIDALKKALPVHYADEHAWKKRLEGFFEASELLVTKIIEAAHNEKGEEWDRDQVLKTAKIRPLRYFHHVTGYGESRSNEPTREDYFSNPTKALIKLEDDIFSLANLYHSLFQTIPEED